MPTLFDMHCHVDLFKNMDQFCKDAEGNDLTLLSMTTTPKAYEVETKKLNIYPFVYVALGLHPQLVHERYNELPILIKNIRNSQFIGEVGLDYNRQFYSSKSAQLIVFEKIIASCQKGKVISIHSVHAEKDVLDILEKYNCPTQSKCILHWYSGTIKQLERATELGCYFSINEVMVNSPKSQLVIQKIPIERLLVESDAPFISNISTAMQIKASLNTCLNKLSTIKQTRLNEKIEETCRFLLSRQTLD